MELGRRSSQHAFLYLKLSEGVSGFDPVVASALPVAPTVPRKALVHAVKTDWEKAWHSR
jgi:hypothetical protein